MASLPENLAPLMMPDAYPHPVGEVRLIETHISWVLLAGPFAYKIKRPVCLPFLDMRTPAQRHFYCREELRLNRRFAPDLYLDVLPIVVDGGRTHFGGAGKVVEYAVRMRQFDTREELDRLLQDATVEPSELERFGGELAKTHDRLPPIGVGGHYGTLVCVRQSLRANLEQWASLSKRAGMPADSGSIAPLMLQRLDELASLVDARRASGRVRECHGDLHCRNVVRHEGRLVAFDGLEFEPAFRWIDVAEEVAFLFMDLSRRGGERHASAFINGYLSESGDYEAVRLLRLYAAHRALVRAKVGALEADASEHLAYTECARRLLTYPKRSLLIMMSGVSGSGKTWLAHSVAQAVGAVHVRSDVERKRMAGISARASSGSGIGQGIYRPEANDSVYRRLAACASDILSGGFSAIVDATFQRRADRERFVTLAGSLNMSVAMVHCQAPADVLRARITEREGKAKDASEGNLAVLAYQQASFEPHDAGEELDVIVADTTRETIVTEIVKALDAKGASANLYGPRIG